MKKETSTAPCDPSKAYSVQFQKVDIEVRDSEGTISTPWLAVVVENKTRFVAHFGSGVGEPTEADEERLIAECRSKPMAGGWTVTTDNSRAFKPRKIRGAVARQPFPEPKKTRRGR